MWVMVSRWGEVKGGGHTAHADDTLALRILQRESSWCFLYAIKSFLLYVPPGGSDFGACLLAIPLHSRRHGLKRHDAPTLVLRQGCAVGRVGHHIHLVRHDNARIPALVQHLRQGTRRIGLEMAQVKLGLPGVDV